MADAADTPETDSDAKDLKKADEPVEVVEVPRRGFLRRWAARIGKFVLAIIVLAVALVLLVVLVVQLVLWSPLPRNVVAGVASSQTGLIVEIADLDVSLLGHVRVAGVTAALPAADGPLLVVDHVSAKVAPLPIAAFQAIFSKPAVTRADVSGVHVLAEQDADGQWNVQRALEQIAASGPPPTTPQPESPPGLSPPSLPIALPLPDVRVGDITATVAAAGKEPAEIGPLELVGRTTSPLVYEFGLGDAASPPKLSASGQVVTAGPWAHEARIGLGPDVAEWAAPIAPLPGVSADQIAWSGKFDNGLVGTLTLDGVRAAGVNVVGGEIGVAALTADGQTLRATIDRLLADDARIGPVRISSGVASVGEDGVIRVDRVFLDTLDGTAAIEEVRFDPATLTGRFAASGRGLSYAGATITGTVTAEASQDDFAGFRLKIDGDFSGTDPTGRQFGGEGDLLAAGRAVNDLTWSGSLTETVYGTFGGDEPLPPVTLDARTTFTDDAEQIELVGLNVDDGKVLGVKGLADFRAGVWRTTAMVPGLTVPLPATLEPYDSTLLAANVALSGELGSARQIGTRVEVEKIDALFGGLRFQLEGAAYPGGKPDVSTRPAAEELGGLAALLSALPIELIGTVRPAELPEDGGLLAGDIMADIRVTGDVRQLGFELAGDAVGRDVRVAGHPIDDFAGQLTAVVTPEQLRVDTSGVRLFDGTADLTAVMPFGGEALAAKLTADGIDLTQIAEILGLPVQGRAALDLRAEAARLALDALQVSGTAALTGQDEGAGVRALDVRLADRIDAKVALDGAQIRLDPITLSQADDKLTLTAGTNLDALDEVTVSAFTDGYAINLAEAAGGDVGVALTRLDVPGLTITLSGENGPGVSGTVRAGAVVKLDEGATDFATLGIELDAAGRTVAIDQVTLDILRAGELTGGGYFDLDLPLDGVLALRGENLDFSPIVARVAPDVDPKAILDGSIDFALETGPTTGERPLGNYAINLDLDGNDLFVKGVPVEGVNTTLVLELREDLLEAQDYRPAIFQKLVSERLRVGVAGGVVDGFVRLSLREVEGVSPSDPPGNIVSTLFNLDLGRDPDGDGRNDAAPLDIGLLAAVAGINQDDLDPIGGVTGSISVRGSSELGALLGSGADALERVTGDGRINLSNFELAGDVGEKLNIGLELDSDADPAGRGTLGFALANRNFRLRDIDVFVNGVQVRGNATVEDITKGLASDLDGSLVVLAKPLEETNLPFFGEAGDVLTALQAGSGFANFWRVTGTVEQPDIVPAALSDLGSETRKLFAN